MRNLYCIILGLVLLLQIPSVTNGQNDVRRALLLSRLYKSAKELNAADELKKIGSDRPRQLADTCRLFFAVLGTDDASVAATQTRSVHSIYEAYADNPFAGVYARQMYRLWIVANTYSPDANANTNELKKSHSLERYIDTMREVRQQVRILLTAKLRTLKTPTAWENQMAALKWSLPKGLGKTDTVAAVLAHYDANFTTPTLKQKALNDLLDTLASKFPDNISNAGITWRNLKFQVHKYDLLRKEYDDAKTAIAKEVEKELLSATPATTGIISGLNTFATTRNTSAVTEALGHPATGAGGPPADWESAVLDGTARFLARRFKEELSAAFVQQFATLMSKRQSNVYGNDLQLLFPATRELLSSGSAVYSGALVQPLRAAMQRDMQTMVFRYTELVARNGAMLPDTIGSISQAQAQLASWEKQLLPLQEVVNKGKTSDNKKLSKSEIKGVKTDLANVEELRDRAQKILNRLNQQATRRYAYLTVLCLRHLAEGRHPAELLDLLPAELQRTTSLMTSQSDYVRDTLLPALRGLRSLSSAFSDSHSLRRAWVTEGQMTSLLTQPQPLVLFQGLVIQRLGKDIPPTLQPVLWQVQQGRDAHQFQQLVFGFAGLAMRFEAQVQQLNRSGIGFEALGRPLSRLPADSVSRLERARTILDLYQTTLATVRFAAEQVNRAPSESLARLEAVQGVGELLVQGYAAAQQRQYGLALTSLVQVVEKTVPDRIRETQLNMAQVVRYGSVMAAVGQARTPDEVQSALQAGALPSGSARVKRESLFTASLNAYVGLTTGLEHVQGSGLSPNIGFTAAIGPCFTWGWHQTPGKVRVRTDRYVMARPRRAPTLFKARATPVRREMTGSALGLFISVIDLGAPVLLHLKDDYNTVPQNVDFRHVFAPGAMLAYSLRNTPITLLGGAQFTANLRQPKDRTIEDRRNSIRYNVSLAFDIPLVHFGVRTEAKSAKTE